MLPRILLVVTIVFAALLGGLAFAQAQPVIRWDSDDIVESHLTNYKYKRIGPDYERSDDPDAPNPGRNFMIELTVTDDPPRLVDRALKRDARISGSILHAPKRARSARVWLEDNYDRVLDEARPAPPDFAFKLDASRSLGTGLYLKTEILGDDGLLWSGTEELRMVPPDADPWADFLLGIYNMGTKPGTGEMLREMGFGHRAVQTTASSAFPVQADLRFHSSNILYSLLGFYHRDLKRWREIKALHRDAHGPIQLARHRCLNSPKERKFITDILTAAGLRHRPFDPLFYGIGDEIGIGNMCAPYDLCGAQWCKQRYQQWLRQRYGSLERLNAQWQTDYGDWDAVEMFSTWQALERADTGNFAPWADRVEFMDDVLIGAVDLGVQTVRKHDPGARCAITGVQQPSCWGYDHWKMTRVVDAMTPYDIGENSEVIMSFYNDGKDGKIVNPGFGADGERLWQSFVRGYDMAQQWDQFGDVYSKLFDIESKQLTPLGRKVKDFADWVHAGPGRMRNRAQRWRDPVAILYSQPSLRGNWILEIVGRTDVPETGRQWANRDAWTARQKELSYRVRLSWLMWLHDVGIRPKFVDASQVEQGYLAAHGYKVLVLARAVALSDQTAGAIRKFVEAGGTVVADSWPGIMDQTCRVLPGGVLDDLFGITREDYREINVTRMPASGKGATVAGRVLPFFAFETTVKAATGKAGGSFKGADVAVIQSVGKGRAVYLNFNLEEYFLQRLFPDLVAPARSYLLDLLNEAGVRPLFALHSSNSDSPFHPVGHDVVVHRSGRGYLVGAMVNPTTRMTELGGIEDRYEFAKDHVFLKDSHKARLAMAGELHTYDLTESRYLGKVRRVDLTTHRISGRLFACWPFAIKGVTAKAKVSRDRHLHVSGEVITSAPVGDEALVVAMRVYGDDGRERRAYRRTIDCHGGRFETDLPLATNEHGKWRVEVREPCMGGTTRMSVDLP